MRPPPRVVVHRPFLLALWLTLPLLTVSSSLFADATPVRGGTPGPVSAYARPVTVAADLQLLAASEEKKQVPKPKDEPRYKPGAEDKKSDGSDDDDSGGFLDGCFNSCLSSIFESLCSFSSSAPQPAPATPSPEQAPLAETHAWAVNDHGWLTVAAPGDSVVLFEGPVEPGHPDIDVAHLPAGAEVVVVETHALATGVELRVRRADGLDPVGWVSGTSLSPAPLTAPPVASTPPTPPAPALSPAPTRPPAAPPRWAILVVLGGSSFGNPELRPEFKQLGFHGEVGYQRFERKGWRWGPNLGVWSFSGNAQVNYATPTVLDVPGASEFMIADLALLGGQHYGRRGGFGFGWSAGPALFYAYESSEVRSFDLETNDPLGGAHDESLGRWTGGGVARLTADWGVAPELDLGLQADGFVAGWNGREEKSLTSDFIHAPLFGFDLGLSLTFPLP